MTEEAPGGDGARSGEGDRPASTRSDDLDGWYVEVVRRAALAADAPVAGCMVIRPYGFAIWERIRTHLDADLHASGHRNAYFPLLIPESLLEKEAAHVEGFAPRAAWVTVGGDRQLDERLAVRPTSESVVCSLFADWTSFRHDLPHLINQWGSAVRWRETTRWFLDTTEYLWQEGHTAHATRDEAAQEVARIVHIYRRFLADDLALPPITGWKPPHRRFAGAIRSHAIDVLMSDGRFLEVGSAHELGQNFSRPFEIAFEDRDGRRRYVWQTSWGVTTRLIAALVVVHGDDDGLILPPRVAPLQIVVVPVAGDGPHDRLLSEARRLEEMLSTAGLRVRLDDRDDRSAAAMRRHWTLRGVPLRVEIRYPEATEGLALLVRRDDGRRQSVPLDHVPAHAATLLDAIQETLLERARRLLEERTRRPSSLDRLPEPAEAEPGIFEAGWCGDLDCAERIRDETGCVVLSSIESPEVPEGCIRCHRPASDLVRFAIPF